MAKAKAFDATIRPLSSEQKGQAGGMAHSIEATIVV
jgi:hypothetical protein